MHDIIGVNLFILPSIITEAWTIDFKSTFIIFLMGFFICSSCGLVGNFLIFRKLSLLGDAISHSLLPGIVLAFLISQSRNTPILFLGAFLSSIVAVLLIESIQKNSIIKADSAMVVVFTTLFSLGIVLITLFADHVDLDTECVLYGEIAFIPLEKIVYIGGKPIGPFSLIRMGLLFFTLVIVTTIFYRGLLLTTFDREYAQCLGIRAKFYEVGLTSFLSFVVVSAFEAVGAILVVGMLLFPGCTAILLSKNLKNILILSIISGALYSFLGINLALLLDCSISGAMCVIGAIIFCFTWGKSYFNNR